MGDYTMMIQGEPELKRGEQYGRWEKRITDAAATATLRVPDAGTRFMDVRRREGSGVIRGIQKKLK